jgi:hypothetical protein
MKLRIPLLGASLLATACGSDARTPRLVTHRGCLADAAPCDARTTTDAAPARSDAGPATSDAGSTAGDGASTPSDAAALGTDGAARSCCDPFVERLARIDEDWPVLVPGRMSRSFSSFDRTGGNDDGVTGKYSALYALPDGEQVIVDAVGPGVLDTLWFTSEKEGGAGLDLGTVRFYLDDEATPRLELDGADLFSGAKAPFLRPLVADNTISTGAYVSWVPVPFARRLIVTTTKRPFFYQAHYETLPADASVQSFEPTLDVEAARTRFESAGASTPATELEVVPLDVTRTGEGTLDVVQFEPDAPPSDADLSTAHLRITWDDQPEPAVDVPLGAFFGAGLGPAEVRALPFSMHGKVLESRFLMPYWTGFRIVVEGLAGSLRIHTGPPRYAKGTAGYFHATAASEHPTAPGTDFEWLSSTAAGRLVGTVLTVRPGAPTTKRWWEGDVRSYGDARRSPDIHGTGHEDDDLGGWSNTYFSRPFSLPLHGEPRADILDRSGQFNANATMYRLYPGIDFLGGIHHGTEHGSGNSVLADYDGVAFYYVDPGYSPLVEADSVVVTDAASRAAHGYAAEGEGTPSSVTSAFEGRNAQVSATFDFVAHTGPASFSVQVPVENGGCFLRRLFDQSVGRQGARVSVDGEPVARFYEAAANATLRFAERDFFLPARFTRGKSSLRILIEPDVGGPAWSVAEYRLLCVTRSSVP